jgi:hypothetical protein
MANEGIGAWEAGHAETIRAVLARIDDLPGLPRTPRWIVGGVLILLSLPLAGASIRYGGTGGFGNAAALIVIGLALLTWSRLLGRDELDHESFTSTSVVLLGRPTDLLVAQVLAAAVMVINIAVAQIGNAWWAAIVVLLLTPLLYGTPRRWLAVGLGGIASFYLLYLWAVTDISYIIDRNQAVREIFSFTYFMPTSIAWTVLVLALVPQLQLIRFGRFGLGRLKGDIRIHFAGLRVSLALTSAVLLCCAWETAWLLIYAPRWIPGLLLDS